ncbi:MAG: DUF4316 domain-containing protein [Clostridia bacterium]|nr:DUF4316 domain-containing protein [Clostridia bacterium]
MPEKHRNSQPEEQARAIEDAFRKAPDKAFVIYQLREDSPAELKFMGLSRLQTPPDKANYAPVYVGNLKPETDLSDGMSRMLALEDLFLRFNADEKPEGYTGQSLSVSDVVALKHDGTVSYHYCDSIGFRELPDFAKQENYLKNTEMQMEDDYGMIDGIINNGQREQKTPEEEKRPSVLEKLRDLKQELKPPETQKEKTNNERNRF